MPRINLVAVVPREHKLLKILREARWVEWRGNGYTQTIVGSYDKAEHALIDGRCFPQEVVWALETVA